MFRRMFHSIDKHKKANEISIKYVKQIKLKVNIFLRISDFLLHVCFEVLLTWSVHVYAIQCRVSQPFFSCCFLYPILFTRIFKPS